MSNYNKRTIKEKGLEKNLGRVIIFYDPSKKIQKIDKSLIGILEKKEKQYQVNFSKDNTRPLKKRDIIKITRENYPFYSSWYLVDI